MRAKHSFRFLAIRRTLSVAIVALCLAVLSAPAFAVTSPETTTLGIAEYCGASSGCILGTVSFNFLIQDAAGNNFIAGLAPTGCSSFNNTIDTIKAWQSFAQAALLSGKNVRIFFSACGGQNLITALDLNK